MPVLTAAITIGQWLVDRQRRQHELEREKVPEQVLNSGYFEAMADDVESRLDEGLSLQEALQQVHAEQAPVLLRPAPKPRSKARLVVPVCIGAALAVGLVYRLRRG